jgi:hypothetical protein
MGGKLNMDVAKERRDKAIAKVLQRTTKDWRMKAIACIQKYYRNREGTGEDFRILCRQHGITPPHPNAWGALIMHLKKCNLILATGEYRTPQLIKSHARKIQVYLVR